MNFDGLVMFRHGETVEVDEVTAGRIVTHWGPGTAHPFVRVVSGTPAVFAEAALPLDRQIQRVRERASALGKDPARALAGLQPLPEALRKLSVADLEAGKGDERIADLAIWHHMSGNEPASKAAARRAEKIRLGS